MGGIRFGSSISVPEWLPGAAPAPGQHRVDELVFKAKLGSLGEQESPAPAIYGTSGDAALELASQASGLNRLCNELADDLHVAARFPENLQILEATAKQLDRMARAALTS